VAFDCFGSVNPTIIPQKNLKSSTCPDDDSSWPRRQRVFNTTPTT
jgi:hypothetical protein